MCRVKIRNFGPIKEGYLKDNGWLNIKKLTVFIGSQGSGKSTVAKVISTFMWIEKAIVRGDLKDVVSEHEFIELLSFHNLQDYLKDNTEIEYEGKIYSLKYNETDKCVRATSLNNNNVSQPKIMYVPAERNFLSSVDNINKVSNLLAGNLRTFSVEYLNAQLESRDVELELPINDTKVVYNSREDLKYILFNGNRLKLSCGASGFHSLVPLYWVSKYLNDFLCKDRKALLETLSLEHSYRRNEELKHLVATSINNKRQLEKEEEKINNKYLCKYLVNIVEEPELNLFPLSQQKLLYSLMEINNSIKENTLIMTTHSQYLISYISLLIQGKYLLNKIGEEGDSKELTAQLDAVAPIKSLISKDDVVVYQIEESTGTIIRLPKPEGIPSGNNYLNNSIKEANQQFDSLLEIEEELCFTSVK